MPFFDKNAVASQNWFLESGYENAWSDVKGWPISCTFHEGRLYFGGSASLPSTLFGSKVSQFFFFFFFNFKAAEGLDDDAIKITLATDSVNTITGMRSGRDLQIFTTGAEFFIPQGDLTLLLHLMLLLNLVRNVVLKHLSDHRQLKVARYSFKDRARLSGNYCSAMSNCHMSQTTYRC